MTEPDPRDRALSDDEVARLSEPAWSRARRAVEDGRSADALAELDEAVERWRGLQSYSINWITSLLSFIGREMGEDAVEAALRRTGEEFIRPRRATGVEWSTLPAAARAKVIARSMVANFGEVEVDEDDEKIVLSFRCGSGGRLIDEGRYEGPDGYLTLRERAGRTFLRDELPVYCAHCSVNNEIQPVEWGEPPLTVEHPPERAGEPCVHQLYKDTGAMPDEVYTRIGKEPPSGEASGEAAG